MSEHIAQFESLLSRMERVLVQNDVTMIDELSRCQQSCLSDIVAEAIRDQAFKSELERRMPAIKEQLERNHALLEQAMTLTNSLMSLFLGRSPSRYTHAGPIYRSFIA